MASIKPNRNISRIDIGSGKGDKQTHGYQVRLTRRGKSISKFFSDRKLGGKKKALEAARAFRDEQEAKLKPLSRLERAERLTKRNQSGVPGVWFQEKRVRRGDGIYFYKVAKATWCPEPGRRCTVSFSCNKHGDDKAWDLAVKARKKGLKEIKG
jgi:hypothetical protein